MIMQEDLPTRRQVITSAAAMLGSLAVSSKILAQTSPAASEQPKAGDTRTALHEEVSLPGNPQRLYEALLDSRQFAIFSGLPAEIDPKVGGAFSMFGGQIVGRNIELVPNVRIVQAWRPTHWDAGVYSVVRFELKPHATGTMVVLDHTGFPEGDFDSLTRGWKMHYWEPLQKYLS